MNRLTSGNFRLFDVGSSPPSLDLRFSIFVLRTDLFHRPVSGGTEWLTDGIKVMRELLATPAIVENGL